MIRSTPRKMLRLIIQIKRNYKRKRKPQKAQMMKLLRVSSTNTDCDQDSDVSFMKDSDEEIDAVEIEEEEWIEYVKRGTAIAIRRMKAAKIHAGLKHTEE